MTELANYLPATVGALLGVVALIAAHAAHRRLEAHRQASLERALTSEGAEPLLPMAGILTSSGGIQTWYGGEVQEVAAQPKKSKTGATRESA